MTANSTSPHEIARRIEFVRSVREEFRRLIGEDGTKLDVMLMLAKLQLEGAPPTVSEVVHSGFAAERTLRRTVRSLRDESLIVEVRGCRPDRRTVCLQIEEQVLLNMTLTVERCWTASTANLAAESDGTKGT